MTPSPHRQAVIVGLFVAFGTTILAGGVLTIGDLNDTFTRKISVTALFDEVNGLQKGDNIWFSGVKVGVVKRLGFQGDSQVEVEMKIDEDATRYIHADALAKIGSDGLIGNKIVVLYGGSTGAPNIEDGDVLAIGKAMSTEELMTTLQQNNQNLLAITTDLKVISGRLSAGEGTLGMLLVKDDLYANVLSTVSTLDAASGNARTATASLSTFASKLNQEGTLPNQLVTDRTTYATLTGTVGNLNHAGERAAELMDGLASGARDPKTPIGALIGDEATGTDVKTTMDNLSRGSELLAEDLEAIQHNFLFRGYFRRKAKAEARAEAAPTPP